MVAFSTLERVEAKEGQPYMTKILLRARNLSVPSNGSKPRKAPVSTEPSWMNCAKTFSTLERVEAKEGTHIVIERPALDRLSVPSNGSKPRKATPRTPLAHATRTFSTLERVEAKEGSPEDFAAIHWQPFSTLERVEAKEGRGRWDSPLLVCYLSVPSNGSKPRKVTDHLA